MFPASKAEDMFNFIVFLNILKVKSIYNILTNKNKEIRLNFF